jgi:ABC-type microcin C transport system duplicated ATPase subunit YejF
VLKAIRKRLGDDPKMIASVFEQALARAHPVGIGLDGTNRYTSKSYLEAELKALSLLERHMTLNDPCQHHVQDLLDSEQVRREGMRHGILSSDEFTSLSDAQRESFLKLTQEKPLSVLLGRAGSGKTTSLRAVCRYYEGLGYCVVGTSLSALAAKNLGDEKQYQTIGIGINLNSENLP